MMSNLVLGIGNFCKPILSVLEPQFPVWTVGVLDFWSHVQEIEFVEDDYLVDDVTLCLRRDLSFFVIPPRLGVRFGEDKYNPSGTQAVLRYTLHYRRSLQEDIHTNFESLVGPLCGYAHIIIVTDATDEIALESFSRLIPQLQHAGATIQVISAFPALFRGEVMKNYASQLSQLLIDADIDNNQIFQQDLYDQYRESTMTDYFDALYSRFAQELTSVLFSIDLAK